MKVRNLVFALFAAALAFASADAQVRTPRVSTGQEIKQMVGDTSIFISYHRPNAKGRELWGGLVPYGEVWRTGANEATVFEVSNDVTINGQKLPKGKYSLHTIPTANEWTIVFNKTWDQWGSFDYDAKQDALRVQVRPAASTFHETMTIEFDNVVGSSADVKIKWGELAVPFTVNVGDFNARFIEEHRRRTAADRVQLAGYILNQKMTASYNDALTWVNEAIGNSETYGLLSLKARLLAEMGRKQDAIATAEQAIQKGKAATPAANTAMLENMLKEWKEGR